MQQLSIFIMVPLVGWHWSGWILISLKVRPRCGNLRKEGGLSMSLSCVSHLSRLLHAFAFHRVLQTSLRPQSLFAWVGKRTR